MYSPYPYERHAVRGALLGKVFGLLTFSFVFTLFGGVVGFAMPGLAFIAMLGSLGCVFALHFVKDKAGWNLGVLYTLTFLMGMGLGPIIGFYAASAPGILSNALLVTGGLTAALGAYAWRTERDLTKLQDYLFPALIGLVVLSLVGIFFQATAFQLLLSAGAAVIFSGLLLVDLQRVRRVEDDSLPTAILLTVGIYLDLVNLFTAILRIMGFARNDD